MFIAFDGIENARELGGLTRLDGRHIKEGVLFRTGHLENASREDVRRLEESGLSHIIDLRDMREVTEHPDQAVPGAEHHHIPALGDLRDLFKKKPDDPTMTAEEVHHDFCQLYRVLAQSPHSQTAYEKFFQVLLGSEGKPVLWHCTQGKDRTGIAAMLLLIALGFEEEQALQEFMLTNRFAEKQLAALEAAGKPQKVLDFMKEIFFVFYDNARFYLDCLHLEYGNIYNFLELVLGIGPKEIETLEKYYLE